LNSSLAQSAAELWLTKVCPKRANYAFSEKFRIRPKTGFLAHNFGHRYAGKSIKGSIDTDFDLIFNKTLSEKNGSIGWGPGPAKGGQNFQNTSTCGSPPSEPPTENKKRFCSISTRRLAESVEGLNNSLTLAAGELWPKKCQPLAGRKGLNEDTLYIKQIEII